VAHNENLIPNPDISRVRDVHWQDFRGVAVRLLPQVPGNPANGHLGRARRVKFSLRSWKSAQVTNCHRKIIPWITLVSLICSIKFIV